MNTEHPPARVAFYGRAREPYTGIAGQYLTCRDRLPAAHVITAVFFDKATYPDPTAMPSEIYIGGDTVRRDGGIADLLTEAEQPDRRFDAIFVAKLDRIGRHPGQFWDLLHRMRCADLGLLVADMDPPEIASMDVWIRAVNLAKWVE